jgi:hypothetical protein
MRHPDTVDTLIGRAVADWSSNNTTQVIAQDANATRIPTLPTIPERSMAAVQNPRPATAHRGGNSHSQGSPGRPHRPS